jgi:predicted exporter
MNRRGALAVALWLVFLGAAVMVVLRAHYAADLSAFLPAHPTAAEQMLVDQLREGPASRLILGAVEGGNAMARAVVMRAFAAELRHSSLFLAVEDGEPVTAERDREFLFSHRYVLSHDIDAARFSAAGLSAAIGATLAELTTPAGALFAPLLSSDPTGEMLGILDGLQNIPGPEHGAGVWTSADGRRSLLVAQTRAAGSDTDAQQRDIEFMQQAFAAVQPAGVVSAISLRLSGPGVFAVRARSHIQQAAVRLSAASTTLIVVLLLLVYRSVPAVFLGLMPVLTGALAGVAAVALGFGAVHGITLGFGITLIGESVDYSIYYFVQSRTGDEAALRAQQWRRQFWPTVRLGVLTSICGFASLLASGFPGLAQLGAYSISGLVAAALVTRFVLPEIVPARLVVRDVAPIGARLGRLRQRVPHPRALLLGLGVVAVAVLAMHRGTLWNRELSALSPVPAADQEFDAALRKDLGTADVRDLVVVGGPNLESVLQAAERVGASLDAEVESGQLGAYESPANYLPSQATQQRRRASLPDAATLRTRLREATQGLGVDDERLSRFVAAVTAARDGAPLSVADLQGTSLATGFDALILHRGATWNALLPLHAVPGAENRALDTAGLRAALASSGVPTATVLDLKQESDDLYAGYLAEAIRLSAGGLAAIVVLLCLVLRSAREVTRVLLPLVLAVLCVAAAFAFVGRELTILHLIGMLLVVAVGSNYALFFAHPDEGARPLTIAALALANVATVIGFGLLAFSRVPVLEALGMTVAPGALLALVFSALASGDRTHA